MAGRSAFHQCRDVRIRRFPQTLQIGVMLLYFDAVFGVLLGGVVRGFPFVTALVALKEDPAVRLVTRIVDVPPEELRVDMSVHVVFQPMRFPGVARQVIAPFFTPEPASLVAKKG